MYMVRKLNIGVKEFALPIPRKGSIETHSGYGTPSNTGEEIHKRIQKAQSAADGSYRAEVKLSHLFAAKSFDFNVSGFIDGFYEEEEHIEEIKTAFDLSGLEQKLQSEPDHPYCLQLKTYGYMYWHKHGRLPRLSILLASTRDASQISVPVELDLPTYEQWLSKRLEELCAEANEREKTALRRQAIAGNVRFPYGALRPGQKEVIDTIEANIKSGKNSMIQAATGLGKTMAVLFPMLKEAFRRGQKLVYVTPKNSQHSVAEKAVAELQQEHEIKTLTLTAKSKLCLKEEMICNPEYCEYAKNYYGKIYEHDLVKLASSNNCLTGPTFQEIGEQYEVCPFELSVDAIDQADIVIADYNYVFSPRSLIGRLTTNKFGSTKKPNLVIDEAHNLHQRATGYYSPTLSATFLNSILWNLPRNERALLFGAERIVKDCLRLLASYKPAGKMRSARVIIDRQPFLDELAKIHELMVRYLDGVFDLRHGDPVVSLYGEWSAFTEALEFRGDRFATIYQADSGGGALKIICCDAAEELQIAYKCFDSVTAFSATLKPFEYYAKVSGFELDSVVSVEFPTRFPRANRKLMVIPQVSTKYSDRSLNYKKIADAISRITALRKGNYIVFFPSFAFLDEVHSILQASGFAVLKQEREAKQATGEFLTKLRACLEPTILLAVQGGVFAEGVDYPGEMLIGAIVVGPPLPTFDLEREILREYYDVHYGTGFHYAYIYPAMSKVVQSAGRVIRSETDRGLIVLMDKRFVLPDYVQTMPKDWFDDSVHELISDQITADIRQFWNRSPILPDTILLPSKVIS
jgi:DNA excision repair protein ERCC-2